MIESGQKTSLLIPSQLPEFVRDDPNYANFVLFLQAYYEWLETTGQVTDRSKNILNYVDIDQTSEEFLQYFYNEFLPYFPQDILADKVKVAKIARELYQSKGTQASFKFLFKTLFNSDVEFFYTKDAVLRASAGKWYVAKSLKLDSQNLDFFDCVNYRIFGETSKSIATIEAVVLTGNKIQLFVSDIQRLFQSGENVRVVDANNQDVLMEDGMPHEGKIVGQISQILISPTNRGLLYRPGDPVIVYGGLSSNTGLGATAVVGETTSGSIQRISVISGGYGYRENPNTTISLTDAPGSIVQVSSVDPAANGIANVAFVPTDVIGIKASVLVGAADYSFSNIATSNANTSLANAFTFTGFTTYPISSLIVLNSGGGITATPTVTAQSLFDAETGTSNLRNLGILAPIQITNAGTGYAVNDTILFTGGSGFGAAANVTSVGANGEIEVVSYVYPAGSLSYPLGGFGYRADALPTLTISTSGGANGSVFVPGILGDGALFSPTVDRVGSITSINILEPGEDYISAPGVSLKVQDIVIANVTIGDLPTAGQIVYQGPDVANSSYRATVDSTAVLVPNGDPLQTLYRLRVYDYNSSPSSSLPIKIDGVNTLIQLSTQYNTYNAATRFGTTGIINYGDGTAQATATFLNGLVISQGQYLDTTGQPSSFDVLQSEIYNNFTYQITLEAEIAKYRDTLLNLVHPAGMKVIGRYAMKSNSAVDFTAESGLDTGQPLGFYTGDTGSSALMTVEPQTTNLLRNSSDFDRENIYPFSEDFTNAQWAKTRSSVSLATDVLDPFGGYNSYKLIEDTSNNTHELFDNITTVSLTPHIFSFYAKAGERTWIAMNYGGTTANSVSFNLQNGTVGTTTGALFTNPYIENVGNGWYRCSARLVSVSTTADWYINLASSDNVLSYAGNGTSGAYVYGAQLQIDYDTRPSAYWRTNGTAFQSVWFPQSMTVTPNSGTAPDGSNTAYKIVTANGLAIPASTNYLRTTITGLSTSTITYTLSVYAKPAGYDGVSLRFDNSSGLTSPYSQITANLATGTIVSSTGNNPTITSAGNGWYRISISVDSATATMYAGIYMDDSVATISNGVNGILLWGMQLEIGPYVTNYVPTSFTPLTGWNTKSNNIIKFESLVGANIENFIFSNSSILLTTSDGYQIESEVETINGPSSANANTVVLKDSTWLVYDNVAVVTANAGSNIINIVSLTNSYNVVNGGVYSNTQYPLKDIVFAGDKVLVANNTERTVQSVNYEAGIITITSSLLNGANSYLSVQRTVSTTDVIIYGPVGLASTPELVTQNNQTIITQDNEILLIG
jgi:hypothetical protein